MPAASDALAGAESAKAIVTVPFETVLPLDAVMLNARAVSPVTVKASAEVVLPATVPTSPVTEPAPACVTTTVPPVPGVNVPNLSEAPELCVIRIGVTTVLVAEPVALAVLPDLNGAPVTLQRLLGYALAPLAWLIGVPWSEAPAAGSLLGVKTVLNEFIAYVDLAHMTDTTLSPRSRILMTYALCGFANFGSLGILIGGLATMAPQRRDEIVSLGMKSIVAGTLATCLTGALVGVLWGD